MKNKVFSSNFSTELYTYIISRTQLTQELAYTVKTLRFTFTLTLLIC